MSKRFIDTDLWKKEWFGNLPVELKAIWFYCITNCDNVGMLDVNRRLITFMIGAPVDFDAFLQRCNGNVIELSESKWFIVDYCFFQYGGVFKECKPHYSYKRNLQSHGFSDEEIKNIWCGKGIDRVSIGYPYSMGRVLDTPQEKEKEKEIDKETDSSVGLSNTATNTVNDEDDPDDYPLDKTHPAWKDTRLYLLSCMDIYKSAYGGRFGDYPYNTNLAKFSDKTRGRLLSAIYKFGIKEMESRWFNYVTTDNMPASERKIELFISKHAEYTDENVYEPDPNDKRMEGWK